MLAQRLFRRRLSAGWRHALWLVVVVRLLLPVTFTSAFSLLNLVSPSLPQAALVTTPVAPRPAETSPPWLPRPANREFAPHRH
ncbi:MAG: hypothetical protein H7A46_12570 [Verrucomicrobiales bacterium]|nr:hypothetical protein [Verrucomicrobiales bacterium]